MSSPLQDPWLNWVSEITLDDIEYRESMTAADKRDLFKKNVTLVEIEHNSYCNRTCSFCPNSFLDRTQKISLDRDLYIKLTDELQSIEYDGAIRFSRYSEPLAFRKTLCEFIQIARNKLPNAELNIINNGDYLTKKKLEDLCEAGLSSVIISVYPWPMNALEINQPENWSEQSALDAMDKIGKRIGILPDQVKCAKNRVSCIYPHNHLQITANSENFSVHGYDRGGSVEKYIDEDYTRKAPCLGVYKNFTMDFDGSVMPCWNLRSDNPDHKDFVVGKLSTSSSQTIYDIYAGRLMTAWRTELTSTQDKKHPCQTCKQKTCDQGKLKRVSRYLKEQMASIGYTPK
jgi:radical SAM protein with 4Fe4S-binding SPASM domain